MNKIIISKALDLSSNRGLTSYEGLGNVYMDVGEPNTRIGNLRYGGNSIRKTYEEGNINTLPSYDNISVFVYGSISLEVYKELLKRYSKSHIRIASVYDLFEDLEYDSDYDEVLYDPDTKKINAVRMVSGDVVAEKSLEEVLATNE